MTPTIYGVHLGHDAGVARLEGDEAEVVELERILRKKHVCGSDGRVLESMKTYLDHRAGSTSTVVALADYWAAQCRDLPADARRVVDSDSWRRDRSEQMREISLDGSRTFEHLPVHEAVLVRHHLAHAWTAFHTSGHQSSVILVLDGTGAYADCGVVAHGDGSGVTIHETLNNRWGPRFGLLYEALSRRVHGSQFDTGKLMGLSAMEEPDASVTDVLSVMVAASPWRSNSDLLPAASPSRLASTAVVYGEHVYPYNEVTGDYLGISNPEQMTDEDVVRNYGRIFPDALHLADGRVMTIGRSPDDRAARIVAASLQWVIERDLDHLVRSLAARFPSTQNLCLGGGVALNILANSRIAKTGAFTRVHVPSCPDDSGIALGAALAVASRSPREERASASMDHAFLGPTLVRARVDPPGRRLPPSALIDEVADLLARGACVAWLQGHMEVGPRALGHRSLLVSPHLRGARALVSTRIKQREWFRPVSPMCRKEDLEEFFHVVPGVDHSLMLYAAQVRPDRRQVLSEVTHIDGTARVQTVRREDNPQVHDLLGAMSMRTDLPILINTSANRRAQPVVNDLEQALSMLKETELGAVVDVDESTLYTA